MRLGTTHVADERPFAERFDAYRRDRFLIGDASQLTDEVARYRDELGVTTLILRMNWPGTHFADSLSSIRRFEAVIKHFTQPTEILQCSSYRPKKPITHLKPTEAIKVMSDHDKWLAQVQEETLEPDLPIIDPHHHLWHFKRLDGEHRSFRRSAGRHWFRAQYRGHGFHRMFGNVAHRRP